MLLSSEHIRAMPQRKRMLEGGTLSTDPAAVVWSSSWCQFIILSFARQFVARCPGACELSKGFFLLPLLSLSLSLR